MTDQEYYTFIQPYEDAKEVLLARLHVLEHNLYEVSAGQPIHNIQDRIKEKKSIEDKLRKKEKEPTVMNAKDYLQDIAGVRVICYFADDIYNLVDVLKRQADLIVVRECDYIKEFRTMSMDFWASMEHRILYKKREGTGRKKLAEELRDYANTLVDMEQRLFCAMESSQEH